MATKKSVSLDSELEVKKTKSNKNTQSFLSMAEPKLNQASSCCGSSSSEDSPEIKNQKSHEPLQEKLPMSSLAPAKSGCCMGTTSCGTSADELAQKHSTPISNLPKTECKKGPKTRIVVRYNVGFENHLTLRGKGANLSWDKGIVLKNVKHDEWVWETETSFNTCEFKVLINDSHYESGENHPISCGASIQYTPKF